MSALKHLRITPDSRLDNKNVDHFAQSLCVYTSPLERWNGRGFDRSPFVSFETVLAPNDTQFIATVPAELESLAKKAIETTWPKSAVEAVADPLTEAPTKIATLTLNNHYMFALKVDRRALGAIPSLLETVKALEDGEKVYVQVAATPAEKDWFIGAANAYERFRKGEMPRKLHFTKKEIVRTGVKVAAAAALEVADITTELITGKPMEKVDLNGGERAVILKDGRLSAATLNKTKADAYLANIRVGIVAPPNRTLALMRMVTMAFRELDGENQLVSAEANVKREWARMKQRKVNGVVNKDYYSIAEISRLHVLPTGDLQERYHIPNISVLETEASVKFEQGGLLLGTLEVKKAKKSVYEPVDNHDILCLPHIVIGGMGSGKTKGYAANRVVQAVMNGFGALAIDPAKGEIGDEVEATLPPEQVVRIRLGKTAISLDWREVLEAPKSKNRLANTILGFFSSSDQEAGAQTARYIRAAVMAMQTGKFSEIIRIFEDKEYRAECIARMPETLNKTTLSNFGEQSEARQRQILDPIYNRLDTILGDEYLSECMNTDEGLNLVELMEQKKAVIIDVPKNDLGAEALDVIINLLCSKIDLAMTLRNEARQHPFFILLDEPHQFLRSAKIWKAAAVESRKWRVGYTWLFHSWGQIPDSLAEIIKSAGPHYTVYASSKKTFKDLAEEISPYTVDDGLKLKRWHAINVLRTNDGVEKPFVALMAPPPSGK